jgi:small subunit ribosomal protein S21
VYLSDNDTIESALKKFKKACEREGILSELKKREFYEKPSIKRKKKAIAARKRLMKKLKKLAARGEI